MATGLSEERPELYIPFDYVSSYTDHGMQQLERARHIEAIHSAKLPSPIVELITTEELQELSTAVTDHGKTTLLETSKGRVEIETENRVLCRRGFLGALTTYEYQHIRVISDGEERSHVRVEAPDRPFPIRQDLAIQRAYRRVLPKSSRLPWLN